MDVLQAGVAVLALGLLPQVLWEAQRALTHSVLVFACAVWFVVALHRMVTRGGWPEVVILGVVTGLGIIAKYNFVLMPVGFCLAVAVSRAGRRVDWGRVAIAMGIAVAIVAPVAIWAVTNRDVAGGSLHKLGLDAPGLWRRGWRGWGRSSSGWRVSLPWRPLCWVGCGSRGTSARRCGRTRCVILQVAWRRPLRFWGADPDCRRDGGEGPLAASHPLAAGAGGGDLAVARHLRRQRKGLGFGVGALWCLAMLTLPYAALRDPGYRAGQFAGLEQKSQGAGLSCRM